MTTDSSRRLLFLDNDLSQTGEALHQFAAELFPIHRAITGAGVRKTLAAIAQRIPLQIRQVPTGQAVLDWHVPDEWIIRDAFVADSTGTKVIDLKRSNLHVVSYSLGIDQHMLWQELNPFLHTLPEYPDWIPFRTAHFQSRWGFCLSHNDWQQINLTNPTTPYHVFIDAEQTSGVLNWGEVYLPGQRSDELLISTHICHPSLANDNLSGIVIATELARRLAEMPERPLSFRFLFIPATIGAIAWLSENRSQLSRIAGGLVLSNLGDSGRFTYKTSRQQVSLMDRTAISVLTRSSVEPQFRDFTPWGYDERQFCSPGFNLPVGRLTRSPEGEYPQYHSSGDDLTFIQPHFLSESLKVLGEIISEFAFAAQAQRPQHKQFITEQSKLEVDTLETPTSDQKLNQQSFAEAADILDGQREKTDKQHEIYLNLRPFGEPKLDRYGLYQAYGVTTDVTFKQAVLWILNLSDGHHRLDDIAVRSGLDRSILSQAANKLMDCGLLRKIG